jgi:fructose-1,6-bisphosphatase/inositol monophosphatase family enzyme
MDEALQWLPRLESLGFAVQRHLAASQRPADDSRSQPVAREGGDLIFGIDREVEPILLGEIASWPRECLPLLLIAEGLGPDGRRTLGEAPGPTRYRLIVDPIDGSRGLMYDKRSAWLIAAIARDRGETTSLQDTVAAVLVELPTSKQTWCDSYVAATGMRTTGRRVRVGGADPQPIEARPSTATDLRNGFAQVVNYFPGTKVLASDLMERIVTETLGAIREDEALVFDDQYISSGGQMAELIAGRDRFTCDLRPLFHEILLRGCPERARGLECHPYDVAGALVATQAGIIITDGFGRPLNPPLDVKTGVHWCGYANLTIARQIQPVIEQWLRERGVTTPHPSGARSS